MRVKWVSNPNKINDRAVGCEEDIQQSLAEEYVRHGYCEMLESPKPEPPEEKAEEKAMEQPIEHAAIESDETEHKVLRGSRVRSRS